jgi:hypothetical protein
MEHVVAANALQNSKGVTDHIHNGSGEGYCGRNLGPEVGDSGKKYACQ